jgi:hypothetical protein
MGARNQLWLKLRKKISETTRGMKVLHVRNVPYMTL